MQRSGQAQRKQKTSEMQWAFNTEASNALVKHENTGWQKTEL